MINIKHVKKFREEVVASGIPLASFLQEKREESAIILNEKGDIVHSLNTRLSGFNVTAYHQSGGSFCASTNDTQTGLSGVRDIITSSLHRGDASQESISISDANRKLGQKCEIHDSDHELMNWAIGKIAGQYAAELHCHDRYFETISIDSILRNDRQKFYSLCLTKQLADRRIEDQFVVCGKTRFRREFTRLMERLHLRENFLAKDATPIESGKYPIIFSPFAAAQFVLMLLSSNFIIQSLPSPEIISELLGKSVASKLISLVDDPTLEGEAGSFEVDEQGNPAARRFLLKEGVISGFISSAIFALQFGLDAGPCRADHFENEPIPAFSNLVLQPSGTGDLETMKRHLGQGILVHSIASPFLGSAFGPFKVDLEVAWQFNSDGELKPIRNTMIRGNLQEMMNNVIAVGDDPEYFSGHFAQRSAKRIPQSFSAPSIGFEDIHVEQH